MQVSESRNCQIRLTRWARTAASCAALTLVALISDSAAALTQDANGESVEGQLVQTQLDPLSDDTTQLILRSVRDSNPQTAPQLAKAASVMMDVELYADARIYLGQINALTLDDNQLFELQETLGSDFFSAIHVTPAVQPEGITLARRVLASANKVGLSPERVNQLIKTLNDPDISIRSTAFRKLRRLGEPAVAELLNVFADANRKADFPGVRGALNNMGVSAQAPLLGAARAQNLQVQVEAIRALRHYRSSESLDVMMRAYLSPSMPEFVRRIALDVLTRENLPADPAIIEQRLYDRSMEYLLGKRSVSGGLIGDVTVWSWDNTQKRMIANDVAPATATRVTASRRASDLYEIRPDLERNREMYLLTQLEAAKRVAGGSRRIDVEGLAKALNPTAEELENVLVQSLKLELVPAAVASCELLGQIGDESLLLGSVGRPSPLVQAILFGDRHLQFAAMQAIAKIDSHSSFAGSSYMADLAIFLAQSENRPAGLVGHNRDDVGQTYAATLASSGLFGMAASSGREFFSAATSNPDIAVLIVTDTLNNPEYGSLIQQLRNDWRTRRLPIALLYRDVDRSRRVQMRMGNDPLFCTAPFSSEPDLVLSHVQRLNEKIEPWAVTNSDRRRHAAAAIMWLAKISSDRETYPFYNLGSRQNELARLLYMPGFAESASQILAGLGTPTAQRELVNFASQTSLPVDERQQAVAAFVQSVKVAGTLLTTDEIRQQYDRYNASEREPEATQKVLSAILDAIESRKRSDSAAD